MTSPKQLRIGGRPAADWIRSHKAHLVTAALTALAAGDVFGHADPLRTRNPELRWITEYNLELFLRALTSGTVDLDENDAPDLVASAARRASEGSPVETLLYDYQTGLDAIWHTIAEHTEPDDLLALTDLVHAYLRRVTTLVLRGFQHEAARITMGDRDARFALYSALLSGEHPDTAAQRSGLPLPHRYLVLSLRLGPEDRPRPGAGRAPQVSTHRRANTVQRVLADHADGDVLALVRDPVGTALVPAGTHDDEAIGAARRMITALQDALAAPLHAGAALATPSAVPGAAGLAEELLELALATHQPPGTYLLDDLLVPYQLTRPGPGHDRLLARFAPLDDHPDWEATLRAYLRHGYDRRATAAELHLHPNSVDYRLGRIAHQCGLDPGDPAQRAAAYAALHVRDLAAHRQKSTS